MSDFSAAQKAQLLKAVNPRRVKTRDNHSHLEQYDVRAHLIRCLGFGRFSVDLVDLTCLFERFDTEQKRVWVGYRATVRLTVNAPDGTVMATYTEAATGDAQNFGVPGKYADAHDFAIKTAESQAFKRCAVNLGDQFGLSLYAKGSTAALVQALIVEGVEDVQPDQDVPEESTERQGMPAKDGAETNGTSQQQRTVDAIMNALAGKDGEKAAQWVTRVTKAKVDANRYSVGDVEVGGIPLDVHIANALTDAMSELSPA